MKFDNARNEAYKAVRDLRPEIAEFTTAMFTIYAIKAVDKVFDWLEARFS